MPLRLLDGCCHTMRHHASGAELVGPCDKLRRMIRHAVSRSVMYGQQCCTV